MDEQQYRNVPEPWVIYDTITICNGSGMYGSELSTPGFFTSFAQLGQQEKHSFFKSRTEGQVGLQYCNQQSADSMDFGFECYSFGVAFVAPGARITGTTIGRETGQMIETLDAGSLHWFETELPRHCAVELKINQDIVLELPAMQASPGYGASGGGASFQHALPFGLTQRDYMPVMNFASSQGVPVMNNRWLFTRKDQATGQIVPNPIQIPRTASVEVILTISDIGREALSRISGPFSYLFPDVGGSNVLSFPQRCLIQASLAGKRLVQQRAQYHR